MRIFWTIRYLDRNDRQFKDRDLILETDRLSPELKAAVELALELKTARTEREFLKFRPLFQEESGEKDRDWGSGSPLRGHSFCFTNYIEDETGTEISADEMAVIVTGNSTARLIPSGAQQHDIDFMLSEPKPIPVAEVTLSVNDVKLLGYFVRDLRELTASAFLREESPFILTSEFGGASRASRSDVVLETAVNDEEIRSFVTIFRRLYMEREPANFLKAAGTFARALKTHACAKWVHEAGTFYETRLKKIVDGWPFIPHGTFTFTRKRLIDVFLYTRYAHQPDENRQNQYNDCLRQVGGSKDILMGLFLTAVMESSSEVMRVGQVIAGWFERYCKHHGLIPDVLPSVRDDSPGIGAQEKEAARKERLFHEKAGELAKSLWIDRGSPEGGYLQFLEEARTALGKTMRDGR